MYSVAGRCSVLFEVGLDRRLGCRRDAVSARGRGAGAGGKVVLAQSWRPITALTGDIRDNNIKTSQQRMSDKY